MKKLLMFACLTTLWSAHADEIKSKGVQLRAGTNQVNVMLVSMKCAKPNCSGQMLPTFEIACAYAGIYPHDCNVCEAKANCPVLYPVLLGANQTSPSKRTASGVDATISYPVSKTRK